jgi:hypothetical protein
MIDLTVRRGRRSLFKSSGGGFEPFLIGEAIGVFDNEDGRFDPWNGDGPLYPHISPGKFVRIAVLDLDTATNYEIMRGVIQDIRPLTRGGRQLAEIRVVGGLSWLVGKRVHTYIVEDDAVSTLPAQVRNDYNTQWPDDEWNPSSRIQTTGEAANTKDHWWVWNDDALEALHDIDRSEIAVTFHDREGYFTWRDRDYTYFRTYTLKEDEILSEISVQQPWDYIGNDISIVVNAKEDGVADSTVWQMNAVVPLDAGAYKDFWTEFTYGGISCAAGGLVFSATANTQADGGGADLSGDITFAVLETEPVGGLHEFSGGVGVRVTNTSVSDGYLLALETTGDPLYVPSSTTVGASDADSITTHGGRSLLIDGKWAEDYDKCQAIAEWLVKNLKDPQPYPVIQLEDRPEGQFYLDLYDRLRLVALSVGISDVYRIGAIEHKTLGDSCQAVKTTFWTEPYMIYPIDTSDSAFHGVELTKSALQTIPTAAATDVTWYAGDFDTDGFHTGSSNEVIIPTNLAGYYHIEVDIEWEGNALGTTRWVKLYRGATIIAEATNGPVGAVDFNQHLLVTALCAAGDVLKVTAYQDTGGGLDINYSAVISTPRFSVLFIGA